MFELIREDIKRYLQLEGGYPHNNLLLREKMRIILFSHGFHVVACYRFTRFVNLFGSAGWLWKLLLLPFKIISIIWQQISILIYGVLISPGASIGAGLYIGHVGGIIVGPTTIGKNFTITHNVTVGKGKSGIARDIPVIGDNVWVATYVVLYGKINIDFGSTIMPGAVVAKNIGDRCLVAGNPARIIQRDYDNSTLLFGSDTVEGAPGDFR